MKKQIVIDERAEREMRKFSLTVQEEFGKLFAYLREYGRLEFPEAKKLSKNLFEIRIILSGTYRGFYGYAGEKYIVILHVFRKKTQKTPLKNLRVAERRLKEYE